MLDDVSLIFGRQYLNSTDTDDEQQLAHKQSCEQTQQRRSSQRPQIAKQTGEEKKMSKKGHKSFLITFESYLDGSSS